MHVHIKKDGTMVIQADEASEHFALRVWYRDYLCGQAKIELRDCDTLIYSELGGGGKTTTTKNAVGTIQREELDIGEATGAVTRMRGLHNLVDVRGRGAVVRLTQDNATRDFTVVVNGELVATNRVFGLAIDEAIDAEVGL
jgi:hypothetical protein